MKSINGTIPLSNELMQELMESMLDITGAAIVEVLDGPSPLGRVLWVNVNGVCVLRICQIQSLTMPNVRGTVETARRGLKQIITGTHDSCPTRLLPQSEEAQKIDAWWLAYFMSQQKAHREIAKTIDGVLSTLA